jgi:hypothetical protein
MGIISLSGLYNSFEEGEFMDKTFRWTYWIVGILIIGSISYILYNKMNKQVAGVLVFMGGMLALYYYYVKWFETDLEPWPPVISLCPEFLTYVGQDSANVYCVDTIGISTGLTKYTTGTGTIDDVIKEIETATSSDTLTIAQNAQPYILSIPNTASELPNFCKTTLVNKGISWSVCDSM